MGCLTPEARLPPCPAHVDAISVDEATARAAELVLEWSGWHEFKLAIADPRLCNPWAAGEVQAAVVLSGDGCTYDGRVYSSHETFVTRAGLCGCFRGALYCAAEAGKFCFLNGQWFHDGERVRAGRSCGSVCHAGAWQTDTRTCRSVPPGIKIDFPPNGATVPNDADTAKLLDSIARSAIDERLIIEIHGNVNPTEGKRAEALALERTRAVAKAFAKRGVPRKNIRAIGRGTQPPAAVGNRLPWSIVWVATFPVEWGEP